MTSSRRPLCLAIAGALLLTLGVLGGVTSIVEAECSGADCSDAPCDASDAICRCCPHLFQTALAGATPLYGEAPATRLSVDLAGVRLEPPPDEILHVPRTPPVAPRG